MATAKPKANGDTPLKPVEAPADDDGGLAKFTWNIRGSNESLTIRTDSEEELKILRDRWKAVISPPRRKLPYMHAADSCLVEGCGGVMVNRTGTNRRTQQPYQFLRCSNHPKCGFTAYLESEENTPEDAGISPVAAAAMKNGGGNGLATAQQAAGTPASA
jgi:predicted RNA-binding Zn-ribbon protein involved in translation (DUF1610 family)